MLLPKEKIIQLFSENLTNLAINFKFPTYIWCVSYLFFEFPWILTLSPPHPTWVSNSLSDGSPDHWEEPPGCRWHQVLAQSSMLAASIAHPILCPNPIVYSCLLYPGSYFINFYLYSSYDTMIIWYLINLWFTIHSSIFFETKIKLFWGPIAQKDTKKKTSTCSKQMLATMHPSCSCPGEALPNDWPLELQGWNLLLTLLMLSWCNQSVTQLMVVLSDIWLLNNAQYPLSRDVLAIFGY